ncbi:competence protein ComG [Companilactobacillus allii]|uniref:Competence protein ComG n=2 Tax=Companilactobacillus allii TaxID=1847728 RepID=A0A1P8Q3F5_9LACO|nr:type II secretion system F family protein [Companilactobacillus allii]APX72385.1 competence protein ComG [Companilactobacillus allii]
MKILTKNIFSVKEINSVQQAEYLLILSKLMHNGFPIRDAINSMRMMDKGNRVFDKIYQDLQNGQMVSVALKHLELSQVINNQLIIAQSNGGLQKALFQSGIILKNKARQKEKLKDLLAYPLVILSFLFILLIGMKFYIIPQMDLSQGSKMIDAFFMGLVILSIMSVIFVVGFIYRIRRMDEYTRANLIIRLPIIGNTYLSFYQFMILQGLGMQVASGLNLYEICTSSQIFKSGSIQATIANDFINGLNSGKDIYQLINDDAILPNELKMILQSGDETRNIAQDLILMSELKFDETQKKLKRILNMIQPILFAIIAMVIVITYLIVLLPVYGMMKGMS